MAMAGYQLHATPAPGFYDFIEKQPANLYYHLNYHHHQSNGFDDFMDSLTAAGWTYVAQMHGWLYFSKLLPKGEKPDAIFMTKSKAEKLQHVMTTLVGFLPVMLLWFPIVDNRFSSPWYEILGAVYLALLIFSTYSALKIYKRISQLREL